MSRARSIALIALSAALAGAAALWQLGSRLSAPANCSIGLPAAALGATRVSFASGSGSTIHAWLIPGQDGGGAVALAHGVRANRLAMVPRAELLHRAGYTTLLFDEQAHGESPGSHITFGWLEALDAQAAVSFLHERLPSEPLGYVGVSQGGAAALLGPAPLPVQALVLESVYPTLREAVVDRIRIRLGPLAPLLAPLLLAQVQPRLGVDPERIAPIEGIRRVQAPLLIIAGQDDRHTLLSESRRLFEAAPEPKRFWVVSGAAHQDLLRFAREEYERELLGFLDATLHRGRR